MGMYVRALTYMMSHGADGLRQVAEDAVLNANYVKARLSGVHDRGRSRTGPACTRRCSTTRWLEGTGVTTLDFAKAMIDEGFHPMTMYFPLVVHGAMLIEPTETEPKARARPVLRRAAGAGRGGQGGRRRALQGRPVPGPAAPARRDGGGAQAAAEVDGCSGASSRPPTGRRAALRRGGR